jgi:hypothetical protein
MQETSLGAAPSVKLAEDEAPESRRPRLEVRQEFRQLPLPAESSKPKPEFVSGFPGGYRPNFPYGLLPFYGLPQTPPSFSPDRAPAGTKSRADEATCRPSDAFARHERPEASAFHHHQQHQQHQQHYQHQQQQQQQHRNVVEAYSGGFQGAPYASFRAPYRSFAEQRSNSYSRSAYPGKHRKWSNNALRALHPPAPVRIFLPLTPVGRVRTPSDPLPVSGSEA